MVIIGIKPMVPGGYVFESRIRDIAKYLCEDLYNRNNYSHINHTLSAQTKY